MIIVDPVENYMKWHDKYVALDGTDDDAVSECIEMLDAYWYMMTKDQQDLVNAQVRKLHANELLDESVPYVECKVPTHVLTVPQILALVPDNLWLDHRDYADGENDPLYIKDLAHCRSYNQAISTFKWKLNEAVGT